MTLLETTVYRSPLGLQFTDGVGGASVSDGLLVSAWPKGDPGASRQGWRSPISTIMGFGQLPGFSSYEAVFGPGPQADSWSPPGTGLPFEVRVVDSSRRYLPELLAIEVPQSGLVTRPLFSAPNRPVPSGFGTIAGEVWSTTTSEPASWAIVQVASGPNVYTTMADELGRYVVYLPYPEALPPLGGSPPGGAPLSQLTWPISASVRYQPAAQDTLADAAPTDPPELSSLLGQAAATISTIGGPQPNFAATLVFGAPLLLMLQVVPA